MKKTIDTTGIANDLKGASLFFRPQALPRAPAEPGRETAPVPVQAPKPVPSPRTPERSPVRTPDRPTARTAPRPTARRRARRQSFEIYEDQMERVKRLALEDRLGGGTLSQSEVVRQAIDRYLVELGEGGE